MYSFASFCTPPHFLASLIPTSSLFFSFLLFSLRRVICCSAALCSNVHESLKTASIRHNRTTEGEASVRDKEPQRLRIVITTINKWSDTATTNNNYINHIININNSVKGNMVNTITYDYRIRRFNLLCVQRFKKNKRRKGRNRQIGESMRA